MGKYLDILDQAEREGRLRRFSYAELRQAAEREVSIRRKVYPNRIETGRMTRMQAERQIALMQAISDHLREHEKAEMLL